MIKLFKNFTIKEWLIVLMCIALTYVNVTLELKIPDYMSEITTLIQSSSNTMNHDILIQGMWMTLCAFGSFVCAGISVYFAAKLSSSFSLNIRSKIFNKVENFGIEEMKKFSTPSLITIQPLFFINFLFTNSVFFCKIYWNTNVIWRIYGTKV